ISDRFNPGGVCQGASAEFHNLHEGYNNDLPRGFSTLRFPLWDIMVIQWRRLNLPTAGIDDPSPRM
ncbi:MAG: hypothetical protein DRZ90_16780, partial [Spirochaetes bacterium]